MQTVTQQLGLGLILSALLITVPPMAGMWFNGVMGNYSGFGPMNTLGTNQQQQLPPGMGGQQSMVEQKALHHYQQQLVNTHNTQSSHANNPFIYNGLSNNSQQARFNDEIKSSSHLAQNGGLQVRDTNPSRVITQDKPKEENK